MRKIFEYLSLSLFIFSCSDLPSESFDSKFQIHLPLRSTISDIEIGDEMIFLLTEKHELLIYSSKGTFLADTIFASPRFYPNGDVEVYLDNSYNSVHFHEGNLYFLGTSPLEFLQFNLKSSTFSKHKLDLPTGGLYKSINTDHNLILVDFKNQRDRIYQFYCINLNEFKVELLGEIPMGSYKGNFIFFVKNDNLLLLNSSLNGYYKFSEDDFQKDSFPYFLDTLLYKGQLKQVVDISEYSSLQIWQRNQYLPDQILSTFSNSEGDYFLLKLLNRTDPKGPDFELLLVKNDIIGDIKTAKLLDYEFGKIDSESQSFVGFTKNQEIVVVSNLDSLFLD